MNNYKIKVKDEAESKEVISLLIQLGHKDSESDRFGFVYTIGEKIGCDFLKHWDYYSSQGCKELTLPQLRDLVTQSKSTVREYLDPNDNYKLCLINPSDAAHWMIEVPEGAEFYMEMCTGLKVGCKFFFKFDDEDLRVLSGSGWQHASYDSIQEYVDEGDQLLWSRETVKKDPALISGADALRALADGKEVELLDEELDIPWTKILTEKDERNAIEPCISMFFDGYREIKFRLKPQTIKLELEIPAPYKAKIGGRDDISFVLNVGRHQYLYQNEDDYTKARDALEAVFDSALRGTNS